MDWTSIVRHSGISINYSIAIIHPTMRLEHELVRTDLLVLRPARPQVPFRLSLASMHIQTLDRWLQLTIASQNGA